jgi:hypothetical protein
MLVSGIKTGGMQSVFWRYLTRNELLSASAGAAAKASRTKAICLTKTIFLSVISVKLPRLKICELYQFNEKTRHTKIWN